MSEDRNSHDPKLIILRIIAGGIIGVIVMGLLGFLGSGGYWDMAVGPAIFGLIVGATLGPILMAREAYSDDAVPHDDQPEV